MTPHKLAHRFRVFSLDDADPPRGTRRGVMDLRKMTPQGVLVDGEYEDSITNRQFRISGKATELGTLMVVELVNDDQPGERWKGFIIFENGDRVKVAGTRTPPTPPPDSVAVVPQDEEPWLITKP